MKNNLSHTKNYLVGSVAIKATGFVSLPFFTNYLTVDEFGLMSLYLSFLSFFTTLLGIGLLGSIKRYYFEKNNLFASFLYSNIVFLLLMDICILFVCLYYLPEISDLIKSPAVLIQYSLVASFFYVYIRIYLDLLQISENSVAHNIFDFIRAIAVLVTSLSFIYFLDDDKYLGKLYADLFVYTFFFMYTMLKLSKFVRVKFSISHIKYALSFGLPVLPSMFASFALTFSDRLMINSFSNSVDVGLYSLAFNIAIILQVAVLAVGKSWQPVFYKCMNEGRFEELNNIFRNNSKLVLLVALGVIMFSEELILILANSNYLDTKEIVLLLVIGFNFFYLYTIYGQYTSFAKKTYYNSIFMVIAAALNILLNYYFIPIYGYKVSAITTILGYIVMFALFYLNAKFVLEYEVIRLSASFNLHMVYVLFIGIYLFIDNLLIGYWYSLSCRVVVFMIFAALLLKTLYLKYYEKRYRF